MKICSKETELLNKRISTSYNTYCSGLFLSARWFVLSDIAKEGIHLIILPTKETAEYCSADLYNLIEGDKVFFLPDSGKNIEKSNYKSSLSVQRTSSIGKLVSNESDLLVLVTYPEALEELIPSGNKIKESIIKLKKEKILITRILKQHSLIQVSKKQILYQHRDNMHSEVL